MLAPFVPTEINFVAAANSAGPPDNLDLSNPIPFPLTVVQGDVRFDPAPSNTILSVEIEAPSAFSVRDVLIFDVEFVTIDDPDAPHAKGKQKVLELADSRSGPGSIAVAAGQVAVVRVSYQAGPTSGTQTGQLVIDTPESDTATIQLSLATFVPPPQAVVATSLSSDCFEIVPGNKAQLWFTVQSVSGAAVVNVEKSPIFLDAKVAMNPATVSVSVLEHERKTRALIFEADPDAILGTFDVALRQTGSNIDHLPFLDLKVCIALEPPDPNSNSIETFHNDVARTGSEFGPESSGSWAKRYEVNIPERPRPIDLDSEPNSSAALWYPSAVRGAPLFLDQWTLKNGPKAGQVVDMVIVTTSDGEVRAYNHAESGTGVAPPLLWTQSLGPSRSHISMPSNFDRTRAPLSNIPRPVGITSTPVIERVCRRLFVVACHQEAGGSASYAVYALDIDTGKILQNATLIDQGERGHIKFDGHGLDQRGGLTLIAGRLYIAFSDLYAFDAEDLPHPSGGWIVSCDANNLSEQRYFSATQTVHGGGIWAAGGVSADDANQLYVATGTGLSGVDDNYWSDLEQHHQHPGDRGDFFMAVVQLADLGDKLQVVGWYQPGPTGGTGHDIQSIQITDSDLGSCSVLVLPEIAGRRFVLTSSKDGDAYLLDADRQLGQYDGHVDRVTIFPPANGGNESVGAPALWRRKTVTSSCSCPGVRHLRRLRSPHQTAVMVIGSSRSTTASSAKLTLRKIVMDLVWETAQGRPLLRH